MYFSLSALTLILILTGCVPRFEVAGGEVAALDGTRAESLLATTSTGHKSLSDLSQLRNQGFAIVYLSVSGGYIQTMNGHGGGGYKIEGKTITIFINKDLPEQEQSHVIAHELVHIKDDLEIDNFLSLYPHVSSAAESFVRNYKAQGVASFDQRVVSYVLGTLFCTEARAYNRNQQLADEGVATGSFAKGDSLPQYIDETYISKFGLTYGSSATSMANWCLGNDSMTQIQKQLVW